MEWFLLELDDCESLLLGLVRLLGTRLSSSDSGGETGDACSNRSYEAESELQRDWSGAVKPETRRTVCQSPAGLVNLSWAVEGSPGRYTDLYKLAAACINPCLSAGAFAVRLSCLMAAGCG